MTVKVSPQEFAVELQALAKGYYDRTLPDETIVWYYEDLCMYDLRVIHAALRKHANTPVECKFFPKPGQIKALLEVPVAELATSAWLKLDRLVRTRGRYASVQIDDRIAAEVVMSLGGWLQLCSSASDREHDIKRAEFLKRYENLAGRVNLEPPAAQVQMQGMVEQARLSWNRVHETDTPLLGG